jgi:uncharacterized protein
VISAKIAEVSPLAAEFLHTGKAAGCPVIDAHTHYGPFQGIYFPRPGADGMMEIMDRAGVRLCISAPHSALAEPRRGNPTIVEVAQAHPGRFLAYLSVNPNYPGELAQDVAALEQRDPAVVGIKMHPGWHNYPLSGPKYAPAFEWAQANGFPILSHTWGKDANCGPQEVRKVAERYPDVPFLMGHSCFGEFDQAIELATTFPNVYLELCAAYRVSGLIEKMVEVAGSDKVLFGSDLPWFDEHFGIGCIVMSHISDADRRNILYRNAERVFGILPV